MLKFPDLEMVGHWTNTITLVPRVLGLMLPVKMVTFSQAYDIIQQMIEMLGNSEIVFWNWWNISENRLPSSHISGHWCQLYPTDEIVQLLGEASHHLRDMGLQSTVCAILYSGECGCPIFKIKEVGVDVEMFMKCYYSLLSFDEIFKEVWNWAHPRCKNM